MKISNHTAKAVTPIVRAMAQSGTLPRSEANAVITVLKESSMTQKLQPNKPQKNKMLTTAQVAELLGVCSKTVLVMRKNGLLQGKKLTGSNKSLRFSESEVEQLLNVGGVK